MDIKMNCIVQLPPQVSTPSFLMSPLQSRPEDIPFLHSEGGGYFGSFFVFLSSSILAYLSCSLLSLRATLTSRPLKFPVAVGERH